MMFLHERKWNHDYCLPLHIRKILVFYVFCNAKDKQ